MATALTIFSETAVSPLNLTVRAPDGFLQHIAGRCHPILTSRQFQPNRSFTEQLLLCSPPEGSRVQPPLPILHEHGHLSRYTSGHLNLPQIQVEVRLQQHHLIPGGQDGLEAYVQRLRRPDGDSHLRGKVPSTCAYTQAKTRGEGGEGGREGGREGGKEGGRKRGRRGGGEEGREGGREGGRKGGREGGSEEGREGGREEGLQSWGKEESREKQFAVYTAAPAKPV